MPATTGATRRGSGSPRAASLPPPGLRWRRVFAGQERELSSLRRWLTLLLPDCAARDDVISVATELGSNAIKHTASGRGGWFAVEVSVALPSPTVRLSVADSGAPDGPHVVDEPMSEHGRGLRLVQGLAARTGVSGDRRGRVVWADVPWTPVGAGLSGSARDPYEMAIRDSEAELAQHFPGIPIWFGRATMQWWALISRAGVSHLMTAPAPQELAVVLGQALAAPLPLRPVAGRTLAGALTSHHYRERRAGVAASARLPGHGSPRRVPPARTPGPALRPVRPGRAPVTFARRAS